MKFVQKWLLLRVGYIRQEDFDDIERCTERWKRFMREAKADKRRAEKKPLDGERKPS